jgi:lysozyme
MIGWIMVNYIKTIEYEEGRRPFLYKCSEGKQTIGIGRNIEERGLSDDEIDYLYRNDEKIAIAGASSLVKEFEFLYDARKIVLVSMVFQMGKSGVSKFKKMIAAIDAGNFAEASNEMLDSEWARQTPDRAKRHAEMMRTGK